MNFFGEIVLPIVLFIIMVGIGISTKIGDFKSLFRFPKAAILGVISQLILLPLIALLIGWLFNYNNEITLGLLVLSLCPSGTGSNIITKMVHGNLALSVSLTTISNFKCLFTFPLILNLYLQEVGGIYGEIQLNYVEIIVQIFSLTVIPTALGLFIGEKAPDLVVKSKKTLKWLLPGLLFAVFTAIMFFDEPKNENVDITEMIFPALLINVSSMMISLVFVTLFKVEAKQAIAVSIESGLKNSAIGLMIAATFIKVDSVELLILAYSFISFYFTLAISFLLKRFVLNGDLNPVE
ncbi:MAG: bile acid:sodium symporter family protein [Flavobacteriales bacterium]